MAQLKGGSTSGGSIILTYKNIKDAIILIDGHGSGIDADTVDGKHSSYFSANTHLHDERYLKLIGGTITGTLTVNDKLYVQNHVTGRNIDESNPSNGWVYNGSNSEKGHCYTRYFDNGNVDIKTYKSGARVTINDSLVLCQKDEGHGKGIDADTVDGKHLSDLVKKIGDKGIIFASGSMGFDNYAINMNNSDIIGTNSIYFADLSNSETEGLCFAKNDSLTGGWDTLRMLNGKVLANNIALLTVNDEGHGKGIDADTLDGKHASELALSGHNHDSTYVNTSGDTMTGKLNLPEGTDKGLGIGSSKIVYNPNTECIEFRF